MEENNSKEINLLQLLNSVFNWLKNVVIKAINIIGSLLQLTYKYKWLSLIIVLVSIVVGQYFARPSVRIYKAEALGLLYGSDTQTVKEIFKQLEYSLSTNKDLSLATKLSLPDSVSKNIVGIRTFYVIDYLKDGIGDIVDFNNTHSLEDTINSRMNDRIYVQIKTLNTKQIPIVQNALVNYFDNQPKLKDELESRKRNFIDQLNVCNVELKRIDSLAKVEYFKNSANQIKFENNKLILGEQDKQLFFQELLQLNTLKSETENNLIRYKHPVEFPSNFVVNPQPINGRVKYGFISIVVGVLISFLILIFFEFRVKIFKYLNANN